MNPPLTRVVGLVVSFLTAWTATAFGQTDDSDSQSSRLITNVEYCRVDEVSLKCDIYRPTGDGPFPAVLAIHGGAWQHGSKLQMIRHAWKLAGAGFIVVAIDYRLAPDHKFPAQVHDCRNAVRWMKLKQQKLQIDPDRIAVFGYSAGGHLAAMIGTTDASDDLDGKIPAPLRPFDSRVACVVAGGAPCDLGWIKSNALVPWLGAGPDEDPKLYRSASPIEYVTDDDPPFIFFHGKVDRIVPESAAKKMHNRLLASKVDSQFVVVDTRGHFLTFSDTSWLADAIEFMNKSMPERPADE